MALEETKSALKSVGITGSVLTVVASMAVLLQYFDVLPVELLDETLGAIITMVGGMMALVGRWKAESKIRGWL